MYNACTECVCNSCPKPKVKNDWCEPCKICHNYKVIAKSKCIEEKMLNKES